MSSVPKISLDDILLKAKSKDFTDDSTKYDWPRDVIDYDLHVHCLDSEKDDDQGKKQHYHQAHCFPLYTLSPFFVKAISFANQNCCPFRDIKVLKLPFRCSLVQELIHFAYDGILPELSDKGVLNDQTLQEMLVMADYTLSDRLTSHILESKAIADELEKAEAEMDLKFPICHLKKIHKSKERKSSGKEKSKSKSKENSKGKSKAKVSLGHARVSK